MIVASAHRVVIMTHHSGGNYILVALAIQMSDSQNGLSRCNFVTKPPYIKKQLACESKSTHGGFVTCMILGWAKTVKLPFGRNSI